MDRLSGTLFEIWRHVCGDHRLPEATTRVVSLLSQETPLQSLLVRRFEPQHASLDTIAVGNVTSGFSGAAIRTPLTEAKQRRLRDWVDTGELLNGQRATRSGDLAVIVPPEIEGEVVAAPLHGQEGIFGALVFVAEHMKSFRDAHLDIFRSVQQPFSIAIENDRRFHDLATLREAAEADRRSLLSRLGRQEMNDAIIGADSGLRNVMERVELVAESDVPVLILGETGTGKEVVSRAIHTKSARSGGPFIRVNCGAIPSELIDSQLFGHERGSFTGAADTRKGWFERADGGTLFLDEIGELPLPAQVRLLRVLQDGYVERVGGQQPIRCDVRVVAATHRDLSAMVKARTFREDLWYRINVFPILLPRLRERIEDIPALARHFAARAALRFGLPHVEPGPSELHLLLNYYWPGNIRELSAVIDRAAILGNGEYLEVSKALGLTGNPTPSVSSNEPTLYEVIPEPSHSQPTMSSVIPLEAAMKNHIERALAVTRGRIEGRGGAAELLKINPHTLRARMRKLKIDWSRFR